jgi:uncharacterized protein (TIGR03067 family)
MIRTAACLSDAAPAAAAFGAARSAQQWFGGGGELEVRATVVTVNPISGRSVMRLQLLVVLGTGLLLGADDKEEAKQELDKLQGTWILTSVETKGQELPKEKIKPNTLVIKGDKFIRSSDGNPLPEATFTIDPTKKPKWIDQVFKDKEGKPVTRPGLYELDGDTLKLAFDKERPKELKTAPDSNLNITVYKREKK